MASLSDEESGLASGINNAVARLAGVVGVVLAAGLLTMSFRGVMGHQGKKDPMMEIPANASEEFKKTIDVARWILEIQIRHPSRAFGAFYEDLLA